MKTKMAIGLAAYAAATVRVHATPPSDAAGPVGESRLLGYQGYLTPRPRNTRCRGILD